jgi:hypothetical protein
MNKNRPFAISETESPRTISSEHCPTCHGTTFVTRGDNRIACPTCSPATQRDKRHVANDHHGRWRTWRWTMFVLLAAGFAGMFALLLSDQVAWRDLMRR